MKITEQQVHAAADRIAGAGEKPTLAKVRAALGGGSFTTISEAMKAWHARQADDKALEAVEVPDAVLDKMQQAAAATWQAARDEAEKSLAGEREAMHEAQQQASAEIAEAREAVATLEREAEQHAREIEALNERVERAETAAHDAEQRAREVESENARLSERNAGLEARLQDAIDARKAAEALADRLTAQGGNAHG